MSLGNKQTFLQRRQTGGQQTHEQRPNFMSQHYNEIPSYPKQIFPKRQEQPIGEKMWKMQSLIYCGQGCQSVAQPLQETSEKLSFITVCIFQYQ